MGDKQDLLFELGTEELPPKSLKTLSEALKNNVSKGLGKADLSYADIYTYATPRRLALWIRDLDMSQPDKTIEKRGPAVAAAYAADGTPTQAALGFAKSCGTELEQLSELETDKGKWLCFRQSVTGTVTEKLIPDVIRQALAGLPIAKRMRWGTSNVEFVRPVHWAVMLFGDSVIEAKILGVNASRNTRGHRYHCPQALAVTSPRRYADLLLNEGKVVADFTKRRETIAGLATRAAESVKGTARLDDDLLDEVTALVEWPVPVVGHFDEQFLELPEEVLVTTMQINQKYFPIGDANGKLLPYFIAISNLDSNNPATVKQGNERVILPRLADAQFFWNQDLKTPLEDRVASLDDIVFQKNLGSLGDKTRRVVTLAGHIAQTLGADASLAGRAALLAKTDLVTEMVGEFASLQGTVGHYYAKQHGERDDVAAALEEQYMPKQSGGELPATQTGIILALAEKLDSLTGIFSAGLIPTGDRDPYALRRAALGLLRIIIERRLDLDLANLIEFALDQYAHSFDKTESGKAVYDFVIDRLKGYCLEREFRPDEFEAVQALRPTKPLDFEKRLLAVREFRAMPESESLAAANKRIRNILRKSGDSPIKPEVDEQHLVEAEEKQLLEETRLAHNEVHPLLATRDYTAALSRLAKLRNPVDRFFDEVLVMADDDELKLNRLSLLASVEALFLEIADISKLYAG